jgi:membrane protease YdiL (CAAX protease family)
VRLKQIRTVVLASALAAASRAQLGLRPPALWSGLRVGVGAAAAIVLGVAVTTRLRPVRAAMAQRELPGPIWRWLLLDIPVATVWAEEAIYRGALGTVAEKALGPVAGRLLQSAAFGLSHISNARATGEPVIATVLATGAAGWMFAWLYERSGSLAAPMLAHLAINEAGAVAAVAVQRIGSAHGDQ